MAQSMNLIFTCLFLGILSGSSQIGYAQRPEDAARNWHQWRGPDVTGVSQTATPPRQWSEDQNIRWKVAIDGKGVASPIVWEDQVFILTAINTGEVDPTLPKPEDQPKRVFGITHPNTKYQFVVLSIDRETGKENW